MGTITPTLPTSGQDRGTEEVDVLNALTSIVNVINGSIDGSNIAAGAFAPYRTVHESRGALTSADGTAVRLPLSNGQMIGTSANTTLPVVGLAMPSTNPWLLAGKTPKLRLVLRWFVNNVDPGVTTFSIGLAPLGTMAGTAGNFQYTLGANIASISSGLLGQAFQGSVVGSDFDPPSSAGLYVITAQAAGAVLANSIVGYDARVELHHV